MKNRKEPIITRVLKPNKTRSKIWKYWVQNPKATVREIQNKCKISSPSVVHFHLQTLKEFFGKNK